MSRTALVSVLSSTGECFTVWCSTRVEPSAVLAVRCALCDRSQARELIVARVRQCADVHAEGLMTALEAHLEQLEMHYRVRALVTANLVDCPI